MWRVHYLLPGLALAACVSPAEPPLPGERARSVQDSSTLLPWGSGPAEVGLRPRRTDALAQGASAMAVGPQGEAYVLDRLNGRVLRVGTGSGQVREATRVPVDAEDLAAGPGGALVAYSPLRGRAWVQDRQGEKVGSVSIPRIFREVRRVGLGRSMVVTVHDAHQETYRLGSPAAPRVLEAVLSDRREGAFVLPGGAGVAARLTDRMPEVLLLRQGARARVEARHLLPHRVLAARVVGAVGRAVCLRLEMNHPRRPGVIQRRAYCLDAFTGRQLLDRPLPEPGLYLPRRELALGGAPARLVSIHPGADGLRVKAWRVGP